MKKIIVFVCFIAAIAPMSLFAQKVVTGTVRDASGPLEGATVTEKGQKNNGVATSANGHFSITLKGTAMTLVVSDVNYTTREISVRNSSNVDIVMERSLSNMDEVIIVGYGKKKRITNTGSVSSVAAAEIRDIPTSSVQNALVGKLPGFFAQQRSGQPGKDASDYFIRGVSSLNANGNKPLIIVDDIEYTYEQLSQINVNEIENITILKDASTTAIFGIKGANGVLVVTTRRGSGGKPKFNFRAETGLQTPVRTPKFLDSYNTAFLVNEAYVNDGLTPLFTQNDLNLFASGADPYGHPNVNWYDAINKKNSLQGNANLDISGGTQAVKYFVSAGAFTQNGSVKDFSTNTDGVNSNYFFKRYNIRSNLDIQATKNLSFRLDVTTRFGDINQPYGQNVIGSLFDFTQVHPYSAPFLNPDGSYAYYADTKNQRPTINAILQSNGYSRQRRTDFNVLFGFTEKLDDITKGLSLIGRIAYAGTEQNTLNLFRGGYPPSYLYHSDTKAYTLNTGNSTGGYTLSQYRTIGNTDLSNRRINGQLYLNYDRTFGDHHFSSLLLFNQQSYRVDYEASIFGSVQAQVPQKFRGYSMKFGYDYKQKYLLDFNAAYNGSDRFKAKKRNGFFPAVGLGWNLSKENFFHNALPMFNLFKIRTSYGIVGSDVALGDQYLYNQVYVNGGGYSFGQNVTPSSNTIYEGSLGNSDVTWEKAKKFDVGVDMNLLKDKLSVTVDYFHDRRFDQLVTRQDIPQILGIGVSPSNVAITTNQGFDGAVTYQDRIGKIQYSLGVVFSYAKNKVIYQAEATPRYPWLSKTGLPINQPLGYNFVGYYTDAEVADPKIAKPSGVVHAGDLKYRDINGDGFIDQSDIIPIGKPNLPNTTIGVPLKIGYKGFDLNIMFQGAFGYSLGLRGNAIEPFQSQFQPIDLLRWTPATAASAQFPRLTTNPTSVNSPSAYMSDYWLIDAHYIRLKTVELAYQLPARILPLKIDNGRVYFSAYNLATWSNVSKKYQQDPEVTSNSAGDSYLNQRIFNLGIQIGF